MAVNKILVRYGTQLLFADHATDFAAQTPATTANSMNIGTPTNVQMNFSVIAAAAGWESAKTAILADAVATNNDFPEEWIFGACMESTATPADAGTFDFYWNGSPSATAGTGNSGVASGVDSSIVVTGSNLSQLTFIGSLVVLAAVVNKSTEIGRLQLPYLYGSLIIVNNTSVAMVADADADECFVVATPVYPVVQAAA